MEKKVDSRHPFCIQNTVITVWIWFTIFWKELMYKRTLRNNCKGNSPSVNQIKLKTKNELINLFFEGVCIFKWHNYWWVVQMIRFKCRADMIKTRSCRRAPSNKPEAVVRYNKAMTGIGQADQMMAYYPTEQKMLNWYKR